MKFIIQTFKQLVQSKYQFLVKLKFHICFLFFVIGSRIEVHDNQFVLPEKPQKNGTQVVPAWKLQSKFSSHCYCELSSIFFEDVKIARNEAAKEGSHWPQGSQTITGCQKALPFFG